MTFLFIPSLLSVKQYRFVGLLVCRLIELYSQFKEWFRDSMPNHQLPIKNEVKEFHNLNNILKKYNVEINFIQEKLHW